MALSTRTERTNATVFHPPVRFFAVFLVTWRLKAETSGFNEPFNDERQIHLATANRAPSPTCCLHIA
jgi:hypothetical protein